MSKKELHFEAAVTLEQAIYYLTKLSDALKTGPVRVATGEREIVISPRDILGMELEVTQKRDKSKLLLELSWREYPAADLESLLRIEPAPVVAEEERDQDSEDEDDAEPSGESEGGDDDDDASEGAAEASQPADADAPSRPMRLAP
ncbi:MAG: amphi-Trp domain-containing protein [Nannocystis sp.]|nr:amphi-Trp domain-containing protein [Nannocystis sp.]